MPQVGDTAPDFELSGVVDGNTQRYQLSKETERGQFVLLVFYPADFSPVCTAEMCAIRDSEFFTFNENVSVWGISGDSLYAHNAFAAEFGLGFPLLADTDHSVASQYSAQYDEWEGQREMTKRGVFLVDPERQLRYVWESDDAYVEPDLRPVKEALEVTIDRGMRSASDPPVEFPELETDKIERLD